MTPCFECEAPASEAHHVVPESLGGTRTVPLCRPCHAKVHGLDPEGRLAIPALQREGIARARALGKYGGRRGDPRQAQALAAMGHAPAEIAEALGVSPATARRYLREAQS